MAGAASALGVPLLPNLVFLTQCRGGFFAKLSKRRLIRGVFRSITHLQVAINRFLAEHNRAPKPFVWTKDPDQIVAAVKRGHQALESIR